MITGSRLKKVRVYRGWVIAKDDTDWYVFDKDEWSQGYGFRTPEFECGSEQECIDNIDSYNSF